MAKKEDLDLDVEGGKKSSKLTLILIILVVVQSLAMGGAAAWYFLLRDKSDDGGQQQRQQQAVAAPKAAAPVVRQARQVAGPPVYIELDPDFVVSFKDQHMARFMQLRVKLMSHDPDLMEVVKQYKPVLRNDLLLLYSSLKFEDVASREGKEKLLAKSLQQVNRTLAREAGMSGVEAVYFTSFVVQ